MDTSTPTLYAAKLRTARDLGLPFETDEFSTLNEFLGIQAGVQPATGTYPDVFSYLAIGNGGHGNVVGADGISLPSLYRHSGQDAGLINMMPFVLRPVTNDLSAAEKAKYALRRGEVHNGQSYIAYYLRRLDKTGLQARMETRTVSGGTVVSAEAFVPTAANLSPTSTQFIDQALTVSATYGACTVPVNVGFSAAEIEEYLQAAEIIYGSRTYGIISEIAICSGQDKQINVSDVTGSFNFQEAIAVQTMVIIAELYLLQFFQSGLDKTLDLGASSPLYIAS